MKNEYFNQALSDFVFESACGGAIRHYVKLGYSVCRIMDELDFPAPYERVKNVYTDCLLEEKILLVNEPWEMQNEKPVFVKEQDRYGHVSFRKVNTRKKKHSQADWSSVSLQTADREIYKRKLEELMDRGTVYVRCFFTKSGVVDEHLNEYLSMEQMTCLFDINWLKGIRYHCLDERMFQILLAIPSDYKTEVHVLVKN